MESPKQVSRIVGISPTSVREWGKELADVLSPTANPKPGIRRRYTEDDIVTVDEALCVGCGNCVSTCSTDALSMKRRSSQKPLDVPDERILALGAIADPF